MKTGPAPHQAAEEFGPQLGFADGFAKPRVLGLEIQVERSQEVFLQLAAQL